jgi:putative glutamine amidotransferase
MKPVIGISVDCSHDPEDVRSRGKLQLNWNYAQAVAEAGGVPLLIPPMADANAVAGLIQGWLIPGGGDFDGALFGQPTHPEADLADPKRTSSEMALYRVVPASMPVLGICYGCQILNILYGGDLQQHLPDVLGHDAHRSGEPQAALVEANSRLAQAVGQLEVFGKTYHHQAIDRVGDGLRVVARHKDGTVEAVEALDRPWLVGVQWHPERTLEDPATQRLFRAFVTAATEYAQSREVVCAAT